MKNLLTRRDFIKGSTAALIGTAVATAGQAGPQDAAPKSRVILVRHAEAVDAESNFNASVIAGMIDDAVKRLFDEPDPVKAFSRLVGPDDVVGIKSNVWSFFRRRPKWKKPSSAASSTRASRRRTSASTTTASGRIRSL